MKLCREVKPSSANCFNTVIIIIINNSNINTYDNLSNTSPPRGTKMNRKRNKVFFK